MTRVFVRDRGATPARSGAHRATRWLALAALAALAACSGEPVGRICFLGIDAGNPRQAVIASPALECPSRTCLHQPLQGQLPEGSEYADLCTAECDSDGDCEKVPESPCVNGFTCAVPVVVGPFCCRKMCICKDYLIIPDGGIPLPKACDPSDEANRCCNLPGRDNLPECGGGQ
ncbi:MAG: hypothetical protein D6689_01365 [Deltaproteobacteria bacterium]|nr:MAG: hypothetical protein D6689_01365 [Deltaproteobacteria bacterium]